MRDYKKKKGKSGKSWFSFLSFSKSAPVEVQKPFDVYLFFTTLLLVLIGIMMIFSSSAILAQEKFNDTYYYLKREVIFAIIGFTALFFTKSFPYKRYSQLIYPMMGFTLALIILTFIPGISHTAKGASRWLRIAGFTMQPSELAKLVVIIFTAYIIAKKGKRIREFKKGFLPVIGVVGLFMLLILAQKDLGSVLVMGSVVFIMLFVSGTRIVYLLGIIAASIPVVSFLIFSESYRMKRLLAFLNPWEHRQDIGFQIIQSYVAFKSGGLTGVGLGESKQKLFYLPEAHTDFIFSVVGEEFGMIGICIVVTLFLLFVLRGLKIAFKTEDSFGMHLALGLTCLIGVEAFINFGVVMGILPTKGLALPFISYGGTSLIVSLTAVGLILNVSTHTGEKL